MSNWTSAVCHTNNITVHYTRTGGKKPPVILLHGLMTNGLCWTTLARALEADYDVIMPDARGHGQSSVPDYGYSYEDHADDVIGFIEALQLSRPVIIGHSMGGMTAAVIAARKPAVLQKVMLADPPFISPKIQREVRDSDVAYQHKQLLSLTLEEVIADARVRNPRRSPEMLELFARARLETSMAAFDILTPPYPVYREVMRRIDIPCLLVFGDKGVITPAIAKEVQRSNIKATCLENAGHSLHMDQPERFSALVSTFIG